MVGRGSLGVGLVAVFLSAAGCLGTGGAPLEDAAEAAGPGAADAGAGSCATAGTLLEDAPALTAGGTDEAAFEVAEGCAVRVSFEVAHLVGSLQVRVEGPEGYTLLRYERTLSVAVGGSELSGGAAAESQRADPVAPAGTYTYTYEASAAAQFQVRVTGADAA